MKKKLVIGNMKMNPATAGEMERYLDLIEKEISVKDFHMTEIVICPPLVFLEKCIARKIPHVKLGALNVFWEHHGAYTGEVSAPMVKSLGAKFVLVGHSERRRYFAENEEVINAKLKAILKNGLQAVLCIGESENERKEDRTVAVLSEQLKGSLEGISAGKLDQLSIVYEPIWAVGSDNIPAADEILEAKLIIKKFLVEAYGAKAVEKVRLLYGGSIAVRFVNQVCLEPAMDGGLVGRESLLPHEFIKIAEIIDSGQI